MNIVVSSARASHAELQVSTLFAGMMVKGVISPQAFPSGLLCVTKVARETRILSALSILEPLVQ